jgi:hypothetical protein
LRCIFIWINRARQGVTLTRRRSHIIPILSRNFIDSLARHCFMLGFVESAFAWGEPVVGQRAQVCLSTFRQSIHRFLHVIKSGNDFALWACSLLYLYTPLYDGALGKSD